MRLTPHARRRRAPRRLWIVNHYATGPDRPTGTRHYDLARQLLRAGFEVTIIAAGFSHVTGREERLTGLALFRREAIGGVDFVWLRTTPYRGNGWRRALNMASFCLALIAAQFALGRPHAVVGSTVHPFAALTSWLIARARAAAFVFEIRDLWPQTLVDLGAMRQGSIGERGLRAIEAHLIRHADAVVALLPGIRDYIDERGLSTERVTYIPNGVDLTAFEPPGATEVPVEVRAALDAVARHRAEGRFVIGYTGALGRVNRVDVIVGAAAIAEQRGSSAIGVVILGDGPERAGLEQDMPADVVTLGPPIPRRYVPLVLAAVDAAVVHATATPVYRYGISFNKLFDYMAASRPVISACSTAFDPVLAAGSGIVVRPDDPEALADAFLALASLPPEARTRMGAAGRAFVEREHDMVHLGARLAETIEQAIGRRTGPSPVPRSGQRGQSGEPDSQEPVE